MVAGVIGVVFSRAGGLPGIVEEASRKEVSMESGTSCAILESPCDAVRNTDVTYGAATLGCLSR